MNLDQEKMAQKTFKARFATGGRIAFVENWLKQHIRGKWSLKLEGVSDDMQRKSYILIFESETDRDLFKRSFTVPKAS